MVTKKQALIERLFTHVSLKNKGDKLPLRCRATGKCKTWVTRPDHFKLPVKYGLYDYFYITQDNAHEWNVA